MKSKFWSTPAGVSLCGGEGRGFGRVDHQLKRRIENRIGKIANAGIGATGEFAFYRGGKLLQIAMTQRDDLFHHMSISTIHTIAFSQKGWTPLGMLCGAQERPVGSRFVDRESTIQEDNNLQIKDQEVFEKFLSFFLDRPTMPKNDKLWQRRGSMPDKSTLTPWHVGSLSPTEWRYILAEDYTEIAAVAEWDEAGNIIRHMQTEAKAKANAALIVRAVNRDHLFGELVEALTELRDAIPEPPPVLKTEFPAETNRLIAARDKARTVLAKVEASDA